MNKNVYIVDGVRTPFLKSGMSPGPFTASDLAVGAGRMVLTRMPFLPTDLDEVVVGCVMPGPREMNIGRVVSLRLGCGKKVPAYTVQRNCASAMEAIDQAYKNILLGRSSLVLAGGTESMSHAPLYYNDKMVTWFNHMARAKTPAKRLKLLMSLRSSHFKPLIGLILGLTDHTVKLSMGQTAEIISNRFGINRKDMDEFTLLSHERLANATDSGVFKEEMTELIDETGNVYNFDEGLRRDGTIEKLAKLRPVFDKLGNVTAANSSQITDGSAMCIVCDEETLNKYGLTPLGKIIDIKWAGLDPAQMGLGPVFATHKILKANNLKLTDIDYFEINEAFAGQVLACLKAFNDEKFCKEEFAMDKPYGVIPMDKFNIDGGAVSMGHPVGASGARITLHALNVLKRKNLKRAIATLCIGGGQGGAVLIERV